MNIEEYLPFFGELTKKEQQILKEKTMFCHAGKGTVIHNGNEDCLGLILVGRGQLRSYTVSDEGKEITLYRLFDRDACLFAASCIMSDIQFEVTIEALEETDYFVVPVKVFQMLIDTSLPVSKFANHLMASRFTDVMWVMDQVLNKSFDVRLAVFLLEEQNISGQNKITMTHEEIARHLGSAREVVTRMLRYFQTEGLAELSRGSIEIKAEEKLRELAGGNLR